MKEYKYVIEWSNEKKVDPDTMAKCLDYAWRYTPSKNNFMNYNVHVFGPDKKDLKKGIYYKALKRQSEVNGTPINSHKELLEYEKSLKNLKPRFQNIINAPYLLLYTQRQATEANPFQKRMMDVGMVYEQTFPPGTHKYGNAKSIARLEIGMFAANFATKCLENSIDIAFVACMPTDIKEWSEPEWDFVNERPILIQLAGHGSKYRKDSNIWDEHTDLKPNFEEIVKFVK